MYYLDFRDFQIIGTSPEILVRVEDGVVMTRPLAGTRPRAAPPLRMLPGKRTPQR
jgi:anthranilate synthase component 1